MNSENKKMHPLYDIGSPEGSPMYSRNARMILRY